MELATKWAESVDLNDPLNEYPRMTMYRRNWQSLNGYWDFHLSNNRLERDFEYDEKIVVPFCVESSLSQIKRKVMPEDVMWYRRSFKVNTPYKNKRVLLHFEAVDNYCEVSINGHNLGSHIGGYLPFTFEITDYIQPENVLEVMVTDQTSNQQQRGKQSLKPSGIFYTATSGIWQTVWLEIVEPKYISKLIIEPDVDNSKVTVSVCSEANCEVIIRLLDSDNKFIKDVHGQSNRSVDIDIDNPRLWSTEDPYLYKLKVTLFDDEVSSYFGMRKLGFKIINGMKYLTLNDKPIFHLGVLDQGYWPESLLTPPTDKAMEYDIRKMKELGFNVLRKHIKIEPQRWYYLCDRIGMLVWQDMVSGGDCSIRPMAYVRNFLNRFTHDDNEKFYKEVRRQPESNRLQFEDELVGMIDHLKEHCSIVSWVIFNEGWGQFDSSRFTDLVMGLDKTRYIDHASGWYDQHVSDFNSKHIYFTKLKKTDKDDERVFAVTEAGGFGYQQPDHTVSEKQFNYARIKDREKLNGKYSSFIYDQLIPLIDDGLAVMIYTQLSDVETENNGILTYDRAVCKFDEEMMKKASKAVYDRMSEIDVQ